MSCSACGGELYQFTAPDTIKIDVDRLPAVCRTCGQITLAGVPVPLPEGFKTQAASMAVQAKEAAQGAKDALMADPEDRIQKYFENVYTEGYMGGFFRALAYHRHQTKEGRLVRLRELWSKGTWDYNMGGDVRITMPPEVAHEFRQLLYLGGPGGKRGTSPENEHPSRETSSASV